VAVIDTQVNAPSALEFLRLLRTVTPKPIQYVINTHYHWDHTNGNALFKKEGATVVSSKLTKEFMVTRAARQKEFLAGRGFELGDDPFLPEATFEKEMTLDLGHTPLRLFFAGSAETDDATAVHVVGDNVLMSGDTVMTGSFPIFGQPVWDEGLQGKEWLETIQGLLRLQPMHIVPGHGPLAHEAEIELLVRIEKYFLEEVGALVLKGKNLQEVLSDLEPRLPSWITSIPIVWGTPRYAILRVFRGLTKKASDKEPGWQKFKPSAIPTPKIDGFWAKADRLTTSWDDFVQMTHEAQEGGDVGLKLDVLRKVTELFSDRADAFSMHADALVEASRSVASVLEKGDFFDQARRSWKKALELNPQHVESLLGKGRYLTMMAYRGGDDPKIGMSLLEKVLALKPGARVQAEAEFCLGMGERRLGNEEKAMAHFENALAHDPAFMPAHLAKQG
jgi:glyoxylase-like metal-dependent hydrolase (beta-lactamase superfamily II)